MPTIAFLLHERSLLSGFDIPRELFQSADAKQRVRERRRSDLEVRIATADDRAIRTTAGVLIEPHQPLAELQGVDLLYLPPLWRRPMPSHGLAEILALLRRLDEAGSLLCAISTSSYLLAEAGLLDGKPATTHWESFDDFERRYPAAQLKRHHVITQAGNITCVSSFNAVADLTTHFIERWYGTEIARQIASQFSPETRRPIGQQVFFEGEINSHPDELMAEAQQWLIDRIQVPDVRLDDLARELGLSRRTLQRRFVSATGTTPLRYLQKLRVQQATSLLRHSNLGVREIAEQVGYTDPNYFSILFKDRVGHPPTTFRAAVRSKLFSVG